MVRKLDSIESARVRRQAEEARDNGSTMPRVLDPFRFVLITVAGWMNQGQLQVIDYLREENRSFGSKSVHGGCGSAMTSAAGWRRGPKGWDASSLQR